MYSIIFQLAGSLLLSWMIISRRKKEIIQACWVVINLNGNIHPNAHRLFKETYLSSFGFCYITIGYIIQFLSIDEALGRWLFIHNPIHKVIYLSNYAAATFNLAFLILFGLAIAYRISNSRFSKLTTADFNNSIPIGAVKIEV